MRRIFPPTSALIETKQQAGTNRISLQEFVETRCPSLHSKFHPAWWLPSGHLQTLYCVVGDFSQRDKVVYKRTFLRLKDGGTLGLDFTPVDDAHMPPDTPIVVVLHGLTGGSHESYVRAILAPTCRPVSEGGLGYRAVVINFRGCAGVPVTSPQLYSAGHTDDIRQAMFYISNRFPEAPLLGLSFSLGANVMTRYIAEEGEQCRFESACVLGCPWNLTANCQKLSSTYIGHHLYSRGMGQNLVNVLKKHVTSLSQDPDLDVAKAAALASALSRPTIDMFDDTFTRFGGGSSPPWPFASASAYYEYASSHKVLGDIRIPFLSISAADDPVVQEVPMNAMGNEWVVMALTPHGGHLGWFESDDGWFQVKRWVSKPVMEWLRATGENVVRDIPGHGKLQEIDGFLTEVGAERLGCRVVDEELIIVGTEGEAGMMAGL
ncbi:AB-hydrolase YheT [Melanogaster broomeanus]|nr:AB-hydrolase YheT [Melanogaster broomeanus]